VSSQPEVVLVDGAPAASVSVLDRALHYGDGLFETIACRAGRARLLSMHLERLVSGCRRLGISGVEADAVRTEVESLASGTGDSIVKLIVTRGDMQVRGYAAAGNETARRIALRYPWPAEDRQPVRVRTAQMRLGENPALAGLKHLNRLEQVLARAELRGTSESDLLLFSSSGRLVSGTMSNVFIVHDGHLITPHLDTCGVAGVMRRFVMQRARSAGIVVEERSIEVAEVAAATELFFTNARLGVQPIAVLDGRPLTVGRATQHVQSLISGGDA
jgi:4-amino-4-deoxychorismate lyase